MKTDFCLVEIIKKIQFNPRDEPQASWAFRNAEGIEVLNIH